MRLFTVVAVAHGLERMASQQLTATEAALSGALARVAAQTVLHPLDVMRTRVQAKTEMSQAWDVMLYGLAPQILLSAPAGALQFAMTDVVRVRLEGDCGVVGRALVQLVAAAVGTTVAAVVRVPQEVLKQTCMAEIYPNALVALMTIARNGGLYRGAVETLARDVAWNSLSFAFFRVLAETNKRSTYFNGVAAGATAALVTHPLDVLKTRVMTSTGHRDTMLAALARLVHDEGPRVLLKGLVPRLLYLGPLASLVLATNEVIAAWILQHR